MKKYPLLMIILITTVLVTIPGLLLNTGIITTSESDNYNLTKPAASSAIHELKLLASRAFGGGARRGSPVNLEEAVPYPVPDVSVNRPDSNPKPAVQAQSDQPGGNGEAPDTPETPEETGNEENPPEDVQAPEQTEEQDVSAEVSTGDPEHPNWQTVDDSYFLDACFIGDSRTKGFGMYSGLTTTVYAKVGLQLYKVFDDRAVETPFGKMTIPEVLSSGVQFKKVYLMFGLNEMGWGNDEQFMQYYYYLIDMVKATQPQAIIYVQQIIHVTKNKAASSPVFSNDKIDHRNELLRQVAANEHVYYLELNEVFTDEEGNLPAEYSFDGVHFAADSMKIWKDYLETHAIVPDPSYASSSGPVMEAQPEAENPEAQQGETPEAVEQPPAEGMTEQSPLPEQVSPDPNAPVQQ